jgi:hypothetical protein
VSYYNKREIIRQPVDVLRHEAGHMVMAKVLGFDTGILTYSPACAGAQIVLDLPLPDIPTLVNFIERRTMVLYAGSMAEALNADASDIDGDKALGLLKEPHMFNREERALRRAYGVLLMRVCCSTRQRQRRLSMCCACVRPAALTAFAA